MASKKSSSLSRRHFVALAASSVGASLLPRPAWAAPSTPPAGIQLYTVNEAIGKDPGGTLERIAKIGYREVETAGFGKLSAAEFRKLIDAAGLTVPSAHVGFGMGDTSKLLDDAKTLGAQYAVSSILPPGPVDQTAGIMKTIESLNGLSADDFKRIAAFANEIGQKAKAAGLQYAYHNHNFEFRDLGGGQTGYEILLKETDASLVKLEADCGWMSAAGKNPVDYLTKYPDRYVMLHIKDFKLTGKPVTALMAADAPIPTEVGRGVINYKPIIAAGRKLGIKHYFVEQEPPYAEMPAIDAAAVDFTTLHGLLASS